MTQTERKAELERLTKSIMDYRMMINLPKGFKEQCTALAEYLIYEIGVIVPPCKVGDKVWGLWYTPMSKEYFIQPSVVDTLTFAMDDWCVHTEDGFTFTKVQFKNDWFSDREEAERALKERDGK